MNTVQRIVKNSGASLLTQVSTPASSFLLVFFIARFSGVSGLGIFSSALSMLFMFQAFSSLGFQHLITREVAQDKSKAGKYLVNASFLGGFFSILMAGLMCLTVNLIIDIADVINAVYVLSTSLVPYTLRIVCQSISRGFEKLEYIAIATVIGNVFKLVLGVFVLFKGYGLIYLMVVISVSHFIIFIISLCLTLKCISEPLQNISRIDFVFCKWIIRATPIFALIFIFSDIRQNIDILILTSMLGEREVGFYSAASKLVKICGLGISFYIMALQPVIFRIYKSSKEKFELACTESIRYLFVIILPIITGTIILRDRFILLIFQEEFLPSAYALSILIWLLILIVINQIFATALIAGGNQKVNLQGNIISMIANILLNLLLIPKLGFIGACIASVASAFIMFAYQQYFVSKYLFKINYFYLAKKPLVSAAFMGAIILFFKDTNLILLILISALSYLLCLMALKTFTARDKQLFGKLWNG